MSSRLLKKLLSLEFRKLPFQGTCLLFRLLSGYRINLVGSQKAVNYFNGPFYLFISWLGCGPL